MGMGLFRRTGEGFQIEFENGYRVSVQFGYYHYCDNNDNENARYGKDGGLIASINAEMAIFDTHQNWATKQAVKAKTGGEHFDDVIGYQTPDEVLWYLNWAANQKIEEL